MKDLNNSVHYCNWANQPYVQIMCSGVNEYASKSKLPVGIYETDDGSLYTFEEEKVTCEACKKTLQALKERGNVIE